MDSSDAYQILITDELARHGVQVCYLDAPPRTNDPEATLLVQVQAVIAQTFGIAVDRTRPLCETAPPHVRTHIWSLDAEIQVPG